MIKDVIKRVKDMMEFNNEIIKNAIMDALDNMERGIEINEVDRNELINVILKYGDDNVGIGRNYNKEEFKYCIYMHINKKDDNKSYIGQTKNRPLYRWRNGEGYIGQSFWEKGIKGYNWRKDFSHFVLCYGLTKEEVDNMEVMLISIFQTTNDEYGYNMSSGGTSEWIPSEESRKRMSEAQKGEKNHNYGKTHSDKTKRRMRRNHADFSGKNNPRSKKVYCNGIIFGCVKECANFYKIPYDIFKAYLRINDMPLEFQEKGLRYATREDENVAIYEKYNKEIHGKSYKSEKYKKFSRRFNKVKKLLNKDSNNKDSNNKKLFKDPDINRLYEEAKYKLEYCSDNDVVDEEIKQNDKCCYEGKTCKGNEYIIDNDNVFMKVSNGEKWFIIDLADYERIKDYKWVLENGKIKTYINRKSYALSRIILGLKQDEILKIRFINDPLDFRRSNLHIIKIKKNNPKQPQ